MKMTFALMLVAFAAAGCSGDNVHVAPSTEGHNVSGFSALGARSDADLPPPLPTESSFDYEFREHMDKQDPRWSDREWRERRESQRRIEVQRQRRAERRRQR